MSLLDTASLIVTPNGYKEGKLYSVIPSDGSGDMSVVRATTATRVNSAGLVELVPYNLFQYSEDFTNAFWNPNSLTVISNDTTAPNGTMTADKLTDTASGAYIISNPITTNTGAIVTFSQYLKRSNNDWFYLGIARSSSTTYGEVVSFFNLATGAIGSSTGYGAGVFVNSTIENVGNGWYRCTMTAYVPNATAYVSYSGNANANGVPFVSDIGDARFQWGAQLVQGSTAKDYQKTETRLNIPRLDYSNGTCPSLLVEPQRTNLFKYSANLADSNWSTYAASGTITRTANYATAPDGTMSATRIQNSGGDPIQWTYQNIALASNGIISMYVKRTGATNQTFRFFSNNGATFSSNFTATDTWQRFEFAVGSNGSALPFGITTDSSGTAADVLVWGAQIELGSYPTSYIPTTSASVTRNADVISKTGISSLIGQTEGTLFVDTYIDNIEARTLNVLSYLKGTSVDKYIGISNTGGVSYVDYPAITISSPSFGLTNGRHKFAIAYKTNDFAFYIDGVQVGTASSGVPSACSEFGYHYYASGYDLPLGVNSTALWKTRLTNTQLAQLTTI
jgi:hypothetical protein